MLRFNPSKISCTTKFQSRCGICKKWHLEMRSEGKSVPKLKPNKSLSQEKEKKNREKVIFNDVENGLALGQMKEANGGNDILLPTLTSNLKCQDGAIEQVILMIDSGSQLSFLVHILLSNVTFL